MTDATKHPPVHALGRRKAASWTLDEAWENCKGQCGADPWCQVCMKEKERLHEEALNRKRQSDDKEG
jgi:hypothetical protein